MKIPVSDKDIAIIGAACRFPGHVTNLAEFWELLRSGTDAVTSLPADRFSKDRYASKNRDFPGHTYTTAAGVLDRIKDFDPEFFGISRKEAQDMDPQQRLVLEITWEALEQAHIRPSAIRGSSTAVFMGASSMDLSLSRTEDTADTSPYTVTGNSLSIIANRVSYFLDLHGPSMTVDTACSSAMVALHQACEMLRAGGAPLAIVGGVNVLLAPYPFIGFSRARMLSPDGRCKVFDASGNGYVRSEGAGVLILKPLRQARKDRDAVLAVIAGTGVNSDGQTTGIALPNMEAQARLLQQVYADFHLDAQKLVYVEAHGTGTAAGDPLEAAAIGKALGKPLRGLRTLPVGSVKSNIGHLEPASGMAGILKALLVLQNDSIPPTLHLRTPNPAIDFTALNITVPTSVTPLPKAGGDELVSVNSFGFGGTNAHAVLRRAAPPREKKPPLNRGDMLPPLFLTAKSPASLRALAGAYAARLKDADRPQCYDIAATLALDRDHLKCRAVVSGADLPELHAQLAKLAADDGRGAVMQETLPGTPAGIFAFSGNGGHWSGMGMALIRENAVFRAAIEEVDGLFSRYHAWSLMETMLHPADHESAFEFTEKIQPMIFALQVGLVRALAAKGISPAGVVGHSVGEVAAAFACGSLTLEDAVTLVHARTTFQATMRDKGGMAAANVTESRARELLAELAGEVSIAAINTDTSLTFAGETKAVRAFLDLCKKRRIAAKLLPIPYPFHTPLMDGFQEDFIKALAPIRPRKPRIPFYSTALPGKHAFIPDAAYWCRNLREPVQFAAGVRAALAGGGRLFLEIGPHPVLRSYLRDVLRTEPVQSFVAATLSRDKGTQAELDLAWKTVWQHGWKLDAARHFPFAHTRRELPAYPWNRERLWHEISPESLNIIEPNRTHPLLGWPVPGKLPAFENTLHLADAPWLADHVAGSSTPYPAAACIESMLAAAVELYPGKQHELERVTLYRPVQLTAENARVLRLSVDKEDGGITLESRNHLSHEPFGLCARGRILPVAESPSPAPCIFDAPASFGRAVEKETLYSIAARFFLHYGRSFQTVEQAWIRDHAAHPEVLARLALPEEQSAQGMLIPPPLLDGAFQSLFLLLRSREQSGPPQAYLPAAFDHITLFAPGRPAFSLARLERVSPRSIVASFHLLDETGRVLLRLSGCRFRRAAWLEHERAHSRPYVMDLVPAPHPDAVSPLRNNALELLQSVAKTSLAEADTALPKQNGLPVHPYMLLHLTTVSAAHELILSLCDHSGIVAVCRIPELLAAGVLASEQEPWLYYLLERLEAAELATRHDGFWQIAPLDNRPSAQVLWRTVAGNAPCYLPEVTLLARVMQHGREILAGTLSRGGQPPLPQKLIEYYFSNSLALMPHSGALADIIDALLETCPPEDSLNILQIARDSRAVLTPLLPVIAGSACRYTVAEKDASLAQALALAFDNTQAVNFCALDPAAPPAEYAGKQHLVIAAFSLHEHPAPEQALAGCYAMLAPGGILCLLEHRPSNFADFVFGSSPSWWEASTEAGLPVSRFQSARQWRQQLLAAGFSMVTQAEKTDHSHLPAFLLFARKPLDKDTAPSTAHPLRTEEAGQETPASRWVLAAGPQGTQSAAFAATLKDALERAGQTAALVCAGPESLQQPSFWTPYLAGKKSAGPLELVCLAGFDTTQEPPVETLAAVQHRGLTALAAFAGAWDAVRSPARVWVITGGGIAADRAAKTRPVPSQGALWGFARVLMNEMRSLDVRLLDLHGESPALAPVLQELLAPSEEHELIVTAEGRYAPRLRHLVPPPQAPGGNASATGVTLSFDMPGRLRNLYWKAAPLPHPGPGEVRVAVKSVGMNFRDVMWSMGLLLDEALENGFSGPTMGIECSGTVDAVGNGVREWNIGDEVLCFAPACFSSHVVAPARAVAKKPEKLSFAEAATLPVAFMTAWYGIKHLAGMQPGERILIHGAAGGVGLAAIQIASHLGLEVYATAGSPEKHDFLRQLGVERLFSSRSLAFASEIREQTNGEGVDAVLNSLAGEGIAAGLSVLRPFGRFLELGKRDFYADTPLRLRPFSNNISFFGIDVDQLLIGRPELGQTLFHELLDLFTARKLAPLPYSRFSATRVEEAFLTMQQSAHIGKIVVSVKNATENTAKQSFPQAKSLLDKNASYLVTGGTGGFGLATAARLAKRGAGHLILASRKGLKDKEAHQAVQAMRDMGVNVVIAKVDIRDAKGTHAALKRCLKQLPPLRGVIHAAALLADGVITSLTPERIANSLAAKSLGAWNIHTATQDCPLDFFVLYSSATTAFGNPGQAGYVAANAMLETLAAWRRSKGLPAQVIGWGPISDTGMLQRNPKARKMLHTILGVSELSSSEALYWLENCIQHNIGASHFFGLDWDSRADMPALAVPRFSKLRPRGGSPQGASVPPLEQLRACSAEEGRALLAALVREEVAATLRLPVERVAIDAPIISLGMDSLMAVELSLALEQKLELTGFTFPLSENTTVASLADVLYPAVSGGPETGTPPADGNTRPEREMLERVMQQHAVQLSQEQRDSVLDTLQKEHHEH